MPSVLHKRTFLCNSQLVENTVNLIRKLTCMETKKLLEIGYKKEKIISDI